MALLEMRRLVAAVPKHAETDVIKQLGRLSCVEVEPCSDALLERYSWLAAPEASEDDFDGMQKSLLEAYRIISGYNPAKTGLFGEKIQIDEDALHDLAAVSAAVEKARVLLDYQKEYDAQAESCAAARREALLLEPFEKYDAPLDFGGTAKTRVVYGALRLNNSADAVKSAFEQDGIEADVQEISENERARYIAVLYLEKRKGEVFAALKKLGFEEMSFALSTTAAQRIAQLREAQKLGELRQKELVGLMERAAEDRDEILTAIDALGVIKQQSRLAACLATTAHTAVFQAWLPLEKLDEVAKTLDAQGCACEFFEPAEGDVPPTATKNNRFAAPFESVTQMYGTCAYGTKIDPNPFMAPFYIVFFGFIMADVGYGLLLLAGCLLALKLGKPSASMKKMLTMFSYCGVGTIICGFLTGSFFGDALSAFTGAFFGREIALPVLWFNPMDEPIKMLIVSIALGFIQLVAALFVSALRQIREKDYIGALCDTGGWYLVFIGGGIIALGGGWGLYVLLAGVAVMLVLGGRDKKGFGKVTGGLGKIYNVIGYASDLLSYSRIMALGLSGAVVAQVFNQIGSMAGGTWYGVILFIVAFAVGHAFNLATGALSAYVHTGRLQYIEFYGKFFMDGGREFKPLCSSTKYTQIKED